MGPTEFQRELAIFQTQSGKAQVAAQNRLILANMGLVLYVARDFHGAFDEAVQDGVFGLIRALERYNPTMGYAFSTFARHHIWQSMNRARDDRGLEYPYSVPVHYQQWHRTLRRVYRSCPAEDMASNDEIFAFFYARGTKSALAITRKNLSPLRAFAALEYTSLDSEIPNGQEPEQAYYEIVPNLNEDVETFVEGRRFLEKHRALLDRVKEHVLTRSERAQKILCHRFCLDFEEQLSHAELGAKFGVTRQNIQQIESREIARISRKLAIPVDLILRLADTAHELARYFLHYGPCLTASCKGKASEVKATEKLEGKMQTIENALRRKRLVMTPKPPKPEPISEQPRQKLDKALPSHPRLSEDSLRWHMKQLATRLRPLFKAWVGLDGNGKSQSLQAISQALGMEPTAVSRDLKTIRASLGWTNTKRRGSKLKTNSRKPALTP